MSDAQLLRSEVDPAKLSTDARAMLAELLLLERRAVALAIGSPDHMGAAWTVLESDELAQPEARWFWRYARDAWEVHREILTDEAWRYLIHREHRTADERKEMLEFLSFLREDARDSAASAAATLSFYKDLAKRMAIQRGGYHAVQKTIGIAAEDLVEAERAVAETVTRLASIDGIREPPDWGRAAPERYRRYTSPEPAGPRIPLPLPPLAQATNGGLPMGRILMVLGNTNAGKSTAATMFGHHAVMNSIPTVHIVTEELLEDAEARYDAATTEISRTVLQTGRMTDAQKAHFLERFRRMEGKLHDRLLLEHIPMESRIGLVHPLIERHRKRWPGLPLFVVVDSPDHFISGRRHEHPRFDIAAVWRSLKGLVTSKRYQPISLLLTTHASAESEKKKKVPGNTGAAESYDKSRIADMVVGLMEEGPAPADSADRHLGKCIWVKWTIDKNRIGEIKNYTFFTAAHTGICRYTVRNPEA